MPKEVPYYDNQAVAAAALNIDIYELRELKSSGRCPDAFRSGRIYKAPLQQWLSARRHKQIAKAGGRRGGNGPTPLQSSVATTLLGLHECKDLGILSEEGYFELGGAI